MRTKDLEFLRTLMRLGSVSEAARTMHMTQSNASKMLKKLEDHFGFQLVERMNGRLYPTEEGRLIAEQVESTLISLHQLESRARNLREMRHGSLVVGTTPQLSRHFVPDAVAALLEEHPAVGANIQTRNSRILVELVAQRQLDFAIGLLPGDDPNVECRKLFDIQMLAAMKSGHHLCERESIKPDDFHRQDFITTSMLDRSREQIEEFFRSGDAQPIERGEASLSYTRMQMAKRGIGLTMVDALATQEYVGSSLAFKPLEPEIVMTVWLMKSKLQSKSKVGDLFQRLIEERASQFQV